MEMEMGGLGGQGTDSAFTLPPEQEKAVSILSGVVHQTQLVGRQQHDNSYTIITHTREVIGRRPGRQ